MKALATAMLLEAMFLSDHARDGVAPDLRARDYWFTVWKATLEDRLPRALAGLPF